MDKDNSSDLKTMIADYMEKGFLENIIDMFRHDSSLYKLVGDLIQDERVRVRIGVTALMEELGMNDRANAQKALPDLIMLLEHNEAVVRGDAANLVGIIGNKDVLPILKRMLNDKDSNVKLIAEEAIKEIKQKV